MAINTPVDGMFRAGQVSPKQMKRLSAQHGWTPKPRATKGRMANFDAGERDEGGVRKSGVVAVGHINQARHVRAGSPTRAGGLPSRGGQAQAPRQPVRRAEINDGMQQKPNFPAGSRVRGKTDIAMPRRLKAQAGTIAQAGGQYGDDPDDYRSTQ